MQSRYSIRALQRYEVHSAYVCKHCIKKQNQVENSDALATADFAKGANKAACCHRRHLRLKEAKKKLGSMLYTVTNGQEIAAPMAALYIIRESPFWFSHDVVRVDLASCLAPVGETRELSISLNENKPKGRKKTFVAPKNALQKYWKRDKKQEGECFIDYCECYLTAAPTAPNSVDSLSPGTSSNEVVRVCFWCQVGSC